ncbi:MAG: hypothetical protein LN589_01920 [Rickettsia endosymbiont of Eriopis connexa]|nr:hypothetical protein [Rickettsia endosymbiont of Eriopis connexa]
MPQDGLYEAVDYKKYFKEADRKAYLIKVQQEIAGFVLLNKVGTHDKIDWNMAEFFIRSLSKLTFDTKTISGNY